MSSVVSDSWEKPWSFQKESESELHDLHPCGMWTTASESGERLRRIVCMLGEFGWDRLDEECIWVKNILRVVSTSTNGGIERPNQTFPRRDVLSLLLLLYALTLYLSLS